MAVQTRNSYQTQRWSPTWRPAGPWFARYRRNRPSPGNYRPRRRESEHQREIRTRWPGPLCSSRNARPRPDKWEKTGASILSNTSPLTEPAGSSARCWRKLSDRLIAVRCRCKRAGPRPAKFPPKRTPACHRHTGENHRFSSPSVAARPITAHSRSRLRFARREGVREQETEPGTRVTGQASGQLSLPWTAFASHRSRRWESEDDGLYHPPST